MHLVLGVENRLELEKLNTELLVFEVVGSSPLDCRSTISLASLGFDELSDLMSLEDVARPQVVGVVGSVLRRPSESPLSGLHRGRPRALLLHGRL